jgi:hypothetical protein
MTLITKGKQYQTRSGRAVTITRRDLAGDFPIIGIIAGRAGFEQWTSEGRNNTYINDPKDLIEVQGTAPPVFKDMCDADKGALLLAQREGRDLETFSVLHDGWTPIVKSKNSLLDGYAYRIAPTRISGTVEINADGQPDFRTWKPTQ